MADDEIPLARIAERQPPFANLIGVRVTAASRERLEAEVFADEKLDNGAGIVHGGALMAIADNLGGLGTALNLAKGSATTTIESKTNFLRPLPLGETARAVCVPLHRGRTTMVWQTSILRADGAVAAIVTQTQLVLEARR